MDKIIIKQLTVPATIGVYEWERRIKQIVTIELVFACDMSKVKTTDNIEHSVDYATLTNRLVQLVKDSTFKLLETLAHYLADALEKEFRLTDLVLTLTKPAAIQEAQAVSVVVERGEITP